MRTLEYQGRRLKKAEIWKRVQEYDIVFLTETKSKKNDVFNVPGYISIIKNNYKDGLSGAGGVAIFYRNNLKVKRMLDRKDKDGFDTIELEIELENKSSCRMYIGSI